MWVRLNFFKEKNEQIKVLSISWNFFLFIYLIALFIWVKYACLTQIMFIHRNFIFIIFSKVAFIVYNARMNTLLIVAVFLIFMTMPVHSVKRTSERDRKAPLVFWWQFHYLSLGLIPLFAFELNYRYLCSV